MSTKATADQGDLGDYTVNELAAALDVTLQTVRRLRKEGLPATKRGGRLYIARAAAIEWFLKSGRPKHAARLMPTPKKRKRKRTSASPASPTGVASKELEGMLARIRACEFEAWAEYQEAEGGMRPWARDNYKAVTEQRRKIEKDIAAIRLSQQDVIPRADICRRWSLLALAIKNDLLAIPNAIAPRLVGLEAPAIAVELRRTIEDALRHLNEGP